MLPIRAAAPVDAQLHRRLLEPRYRPRNRNAGSRARGACCLDSAGTRNRNTGSPIRYRRHILRGSIASLNIHSSPFSANHRGRAARVSGDAVNERAHRACDGAAELVSVPVGPQLLLRCAHPDEDNLRTARPAATLRCAQQHRHSASQVCANRGARAHGGPVGAYGAHVSRTVPLNYRRAVRLLRELLGGGLGVTRMLRLRPNARRARRGAGRGGGPVPMGPAGRASRRADWRR